MTNKVLANLHTFNNSNFKLHTLGEWAYLAGRAICALNFNVAPHTQACIEPKDKNVQLAIVDRKFFVGF